MISDPLYVAYHDREWGVPLHDDRALFEFLILEGAQAGLSWLTVPAGAVVLVQIVRGNADGFNGNVGIPRLDFALA